MWWPNNDYSFADVIIIIYIYNNMWIMCDIKFFSVRFHMFQHQYKNDANCYLSIQDSTHNLCFYFLQLYALYFVLFLTSSTSIQQRGRNLAGKLIILNNNASCSHNPEFMCHFQWITYTIRIYIMCIYTYTISDNHINNACI